MCQGLLPSRRHFEKREDPGDEVDNTIFLSCTLSKMAAIRDKKGVFARRKELERHRKLSNFWNKNIPYDTTSNDSEAPSRPKTAGVEHHW